MSEVILAPPAPSENEQNETYEDQNENYEQQETYQIPNNGELAVLYEERNDILSSQAENGDFPDPYMGMGKGVLELVQKDIDDKEAAVALDGNADPRDELALAKEAQADSFVNSWESALLAEDAEKRIDEEDGKN